jgi:FKBP-type peptidyl-prolyl cis-trans isomerase FkpA
MKPALFRFHLSSMLSALAALTLQCAPLLMLSPDTLAQATGGAPVRLSLQKIDKQIGSGAEVIGGSVVTVHYTGWLFNPNSQLQRGPSFDTSIGSSPLVFTVGFGKVIKGWDLGVVGMRVGGKRTLIIPAELAYGSRGAGDNIPPNANLIFDIEVLDAK